MAKKKKLSESFTDDSSEEVKPASQSTSNFEKIGTLVNDLNKTFGQAIIKTGNNIPGIRKVPFGEPSLDLASDGGIPIGRFTEFLGVEHSGKTRNALIAMGKFQHYCFGCDTPEALDVEWAIDNRGNPYVHSCTCKNCSNPVPTIQVMIDVEGTTDPAFMENFGIDINGVIYVRPDLPSQAVDIVDTFLRMPEVGLVLLDSVGSMGSDKEVVTAMADDKMNQNALFLNKATRKWQMALNANTNKTGKENGTTLIIINQSYQTIGMFSYEVAQGGRGLRHGKGMSLKTTIREKVKDPKSGAITGVHVQVSNEKNKTGIPYRKKEYFLNLDSSDTEIGYCQTNRIMQYIELAIEFGIIEQRGGWFAYGDKKWQGKASLIDAFDEDIKNEVDKILYKR